MGAERTLTSANFCIQASRTHDETKTLRATFGRLTPTAVTVSAVSSYSENARIFGEGRGPAG
jgi:hypothetical protein